MDMSLALGVSLLGFFTIAPSGGSVSSRKRSDVTLSGGWLVVGCSALLRRTSSNRHESG
jgi:hypothetical protein